MINSLQITTQSKSLSVVIEKNIQSASSDQSKGWTLSTLYEHNKYMSQVYTVHMGRPIAWYEKMYL